MALNDIMLFCTDIILFLIIMSIFNYSQEITFESISNCQLVVKYLNERLKKSSPHVKYKVR